MIFLSCADVSVIVLFTLLRLFLWFISAMQLHAYTQLGVYSFLGVMLYYGDLYAASANFRIYCSIRLSPYRIL